MKSIEKLKIELNYFPGNTLLIIFFGALWVRIYGVSSYYYNPDEIQFLIIAKGDTLAEVWRRGLAELHPPLAHFIRHYLLMITDEVFHQRLFSVAASLVSLLGMYRIGCLLRGKFLGLFCALCFAFFPVAVSTSITIRNYAFFMAFLSWAIFYFIRYQTREKRIDLFGFTLLLFLASATHFTGFLVGAACGLAQGCRLASTKRWQPLLLLSLSFLPLLALGLFFYVHYLAPGTAGPMWNQYVIETGFAPKDFISRFHATFFRIFAYFIPLIKIAEQKSNADLFLLVFTTILVFSIYLRGLLKVRNKNPTIFSVMLTLWGIAIIASLGNFYPFSAGRHCIYLLLFIVVPFGHELEDVIKAINYPRITKYLLITTISLFVFFLVKKDRYLKYFEEVSLKQNDFERGQLFLHQHIRPKDVIIAERVPSYSYFPYEIDAGKTPYDKYVDLDYYHHTTVLAPFDPPFKPHHSWEPFRDDLQTRLTSAITTQDNKAWFVMYGWKNAELWHLVNCEAIQPQLQDIFSRDGVLVFSIQVKQLIAFMKNISAWEFCYSNYKPLVSAESFNAYFQIASIKELTAKTK